MNLFQFGYILSSIGGHGQYLLRVQSVNLEVFGDAVLLFEEQFAARLRDCR